jgi:pSer/pThr/pTyr-binding forkhead associated (FHA) protein
VASRKQVELIVRRSGQPEWRRILSAGVTQMGRAEDNDLVLPDIGVSRRHARIVIERDEVRIEDMGSGNGTFFRGRRVESQVVQDGDEAVVDPFTLVFQIRGGPPEEDDETIRSPEEQAAALQLVVLAGHRLQPSYPVTVAGLGMGRSPAQDVVLFDPAASRDHARIEPRSDGWWLLDRGSANGTYVNGARVHEVQKLSPGDHIRIGATEFRFESQGAAAAPQPAAPAWSPPAPAAPAWTTPPAAPAPQTAPQRPAPAPQRPAPTPPAPAPPAPAPQRAAPAPQRPAAAPTPAPAASGGGSRLVPVVIAAVLGLGLVVVGGGLLTAAWFATRDGGSLGSLMGGAGGPDPADLPPAYTVKAENVGEVNALLAEGAMHARQGRPVEAVTKYYKVSNNLEPAHPEAKRKGLVTCEDIAFGVLVDELRAAGMDDKAKKQEVKDALSLADAALEGKGTLWEARRAVEKAMTLVPGDKDLPGRRSRLVKAMNDATSSEAGKKVAAAVAVSLQAGETAAAAGNWAEAKSAFQAAIAADPQRITPGSWRAEDLLAAASVRAGG